MPSQHGLSYAFHFGRRLRGSRPGHGLRNAGPHAGRVLLRSRLSREGMALPASELSLGNCPWQEETWWSKWRRRLGCLTDMFTGRYLYSLYTKRAAVSEARHVKVA